MSPTTRHPRPAARSTAGRAPSRRAVAALLLAVALPLAACSDDTVDPGPAPAPAEPTETSDPGGSQAPTDELTEDPAATPSDGGPSDSVPTSDG